MAQDSLKLEEARKDARGASFAGRAQKGASKAL